MLETKSGWANLDRINEEEIKDTEIVQDGG